MLFNPVYDPSNNGHGPTTSEANPFAEPLLAFIDFTELPAQGAHCTFRVAVEDLEQFMNILLFRGLESIGYDSCKVRVDDTFGQQLYPGIEVPGCGFICSNDEEYLASVCIHLSTVIKQLKLLGLDTWNFQSLLIALIAVWDRKNGDDVQSWQTESGLILNPVHLVATWKCVITNLLDVLNETFENVLVDDFAQHEWWLVQNFLESWAADVEAEIVG